jgi:hypothetical protein
MAYGDRRQPSFAATRRTYSVSRVPPKMLGVGQIRDRLVPPLRIRGYGVGQSLSDVASIAADPVSAIEQAVPGISSLFSGADGGENDPRVKLLAQAYQQAVAGLNVATPYPGTGLPYLQNWLTDQPPHPNYSNAIAQKLIAAVQSHSESAAQAAVPVSVAPAINPATGQPVASTYAGAGVTTFNPLLVGAVVLGLVLLFRK